MPCYDSRDDDDRQRNYQLASVLCGLITKNGLGILDNLNWKEIGVDKVIVLRWWEAHQKEDERRRKREREESKNKLLTKQGLAKLTTEEINAILKKR